MAMLQKIFTKSIICAIIQGENTSKDGSNMRNLNKKEQAVLDCIRRLNRENGYPPSVRDIGAALGYQSSSTVQMYLDRLETLGCLRRDGGKSRSILLNETNRSGNILCLKSDVLPRTEWSDDDFEGEFPFCYFGALPEDARTVAVLQDGVYWIVSRSESLLPSCLPVFLVGRKLTLQTDEADEGGLLLGGLIGKVILPNFLS